MTLETPHNPASRTNPEHSSNMPNPKSSGSQLVLRRC